MSGEAYRAALYMRLSKEDDRNEEDSSSIQTQRKMLQSFAKENGLGGSGVFCFPVRFVHCKYNTPILKKEYSKPTTFLPKTYRKPTFFKKHKKSRLNICSYF